MDNALNSVHACVYMHVHLCMLKLVYMYVHHVCMYDPFQFTKLSSVSHFTVYLVDTQEASRKLGHPSHTYFMNTGVDVTLHQ